MCARALDDGVCKTMGVFLCHNSKKSVDMCSKGPPLAFDAQAEARLPITQHRNQVLYVVHHYPSPRRLHHQRGAAMDMTAFQAHVSSAVLVQLRTSGSSRSATNVKTCIARDK